MKPTKIRYAYLEKNLIGGLACFSGVPALRAGKVGHDLRLPFPGRSASRSGTGNDGTRRPDLPSLPIPAYEPASLGDAYSRPRCRVAIGDYTGTETGATHTPDRLFEPGSYCLTAYNDAENITVSGTMATAAAASGNWDGVGGFITDTSGWLFTSTQEVTVEKDCDHAFTAAMRQQVRELILTVEPKGDAAGRIESIEGYLSGAAGTLDFATGVHGTPSNVELRFTKITEGSDAGKWSATVRLLGVAGSTQRLTATIAYVGGNPRPTGFDSDLTQALGGFNDNKTVPLTLGGTVTETPTAVGVGATVDDWTEVDGGSADAS